MNIDREKVADQIRAQGADSWVDPTLLHAFSHMENNVGELFSLYESHDDPFDPFEDLFDPFRDEDLFDPFGDEDF